MNEDLSTIITLFRLFVVLAFPVPVQITLRLKHFAALAEELFGRFHRPIFHVNALVLREIAVALERLAAHVTRERCLAGVHSNVFAKLVGRIETLSAISAFECADFEVALFVVAE